MRLIFLGTGTSFGVPQIGCGCAVCSSTDPRDRRSRSGALLDAGGRFLLIDTPPELRLQMLREGLSRVDAVLYTHEHADHVNGIDDLRIFSVRQGRPLACYGPAETLERVRQAFPYIFDDQIRAFEGTSKPELELHALEPGREVEIAGVKVLPLAFEHGFVRVFGYRFGPLAYITDVKAIGPEAFPALRGLKVLVLNALWWRPHPTHLSIREAVETAQALGAERTFLTHLTHETGHAELERQLPPRVAPAYDGLAIEVDG
ncbi:MAG TPA: MBL fold metallo-hydrolase [Gemmatimonadales bacterium]|jgi:phosphoribosyl 1,2-cyclic phosphate phosphodiesterase|nr:MBL fold metallo-hydrolase [Gemmatimonadales bacterium]